jgi:hypothetical protein
VAWTLLIRATSSLTLRVRPKNRALSPASKAASPLYGHVVLGICGDRSVASSDAVRASCHRCRQHRRSYSPSIAGGVPFLRASPISTTSTDSSGSNFSGTLLPQRQSPIRCLVTADALGSRCRRVSVAENATVSNRGSPAHAINADSASANAARAAGSSVPAIAPYLLNLKANHASDDSPRRDQTFRTLIARSCPRANSPDALTESPRRNGKPAHNS